MTSPITLCPISHLPSSSPSPAPNPLALSPLTHTAIAARFELLPEGLHVGQVQFVEGDGHLSDGIISAEAVVVENLQVQSPLDHLLIRETWEGI